MSRVYFHSPSGDVGLRGSERVWLGHVAKGLGTYAWDLDRVGADCTRAYELMEMSPEREPGADYLHGMMRESKLVDAEYRRMSEAHQEAGALGGWTSGPRFNPEPGRRFIDALRTNLRVDGLKLSFGGRQINTGDVELNTALVFGSDVLALAAKIYGWCECRAYFEGQDRAWAADIMQQGLDAGIYRRGMWYHNGRGEEKRWATQGWEELIAFLRVRDDEPVVMSYSVCDQFPDRHFAEGWTPPELPADWRASWAGSEQGASEWEALDESDKDSYRREAISGAWYELPVEEQWEYAMCGLRVKQPWARISPDTLHTVGFGPLVTVYGLFAPDRDDRIAAAFRAEDEENETLPVTG